MCHFYSVNAADMVNELFEVTKELDSWSPEEMNLVVNVLEDMTADNLINQADVAEKMVGTVDVLVGAGDEELKRAQNEKDTSRR